MSKIYAILLILEVGIAFFLSATTWLLGIMFLPILVLGSANGDWLFLIIVLIWLAGAAGLFAVVSLTVKSIDPSLNILPGPLIILCILFGLVAHLVWSFTLGGTPTSIETAFYFAAPVLVCIHLAIINRDYLFK